MSSRTISKRFQKKLIIMVFFRERNLDELGWGDARITRKAFMPYPVFNCIQVYYLYIKREKYTGHCRD